MNGSKPWEFTEVHCLRHQLLGRWHFFLGPAQKESGTPMEGKEFGEHFDTNHRCGGLDHGFCLNRWCAFYLYGLDHYLVGISIRI